MGVLACDRSGCENIMCDRYSPEYGYICDSCFEELVQSGPETNVGQFMETRPRPESSPEEARARYSVVFKSRMEEEW